MNYQNPNTLQAVILDWAGTVVDFGSFAPTQIFVEAFAEFVNDAGYASPIRTPRGRDIAAACGQLKSESERLRKTERLRLELELSEADLAMRAMVAGHGED